MAETSRSRLDRDALAWCRDERDRAIETLRRIEDEGWTFHETRGDDRMRDATAKRANRQRQIIERMDRLIAQFEEHEVKAPSRTCRRHEVGIAGDDHLSRSRNGVLVGGPFKRPMSEQGAPYTDRRRWTPRKARFACRGALGRDRDAQRPEGEGRARRL